MVCTTKDLLEWNNFPKGLKVLVLAKDSHSASEITSKLEGMDYIVSTFHGEDEALSSVLDKFETFHVAIVEVSTIDNNGSFKFLRMTKDLPTVMVADAQCLTTTMNCIAHGAVEVLNKPLCDDKIRNIWQHVLHKAYNAGESALPEEPTPVTDSTMINEEMQCLYDDDGCEFDKYPAPSTPQLKQVRTQDDDASWNDRNKCCTEKDSTEHCHHHHHQESKSVDTTCCNATQQQLLRDGGAIKEENDSADGYHQKNTRKESKKASDSCGPCGPKTYRKKMKVDWTAELHKKFIQAVEQLGIDQAIPSRILELMKVDGLTRHNVASHLQKYRMQRRHTLPKRDEMRQPLRSMQSSYFYQHKPIMTFPPHTAYHSCKGYPVWIQPGCHAAGLQPWPWKSYSTMHAEAWGCPVIPSLQSSCSYYPQNMSGSYSGTVTNGEGLPQSFRDDHLDDEFIDGMIKEAINKPPWVPLPIGLKPPSTESVLVELYKQGISNIPPTHKNTN